MTATHKCTRCGGTGKEPNQDKISDDMRMLRQRYRVKQKDVAAALGYSTAYICALENGSRSWSDKMAKAFKTTVKRLSLKK